MELKIPLSTFQFSMADTFKWNLILYRSTYAKGVRSQNINYPNYRTPLGFTAQNSIHELGAGHGYTHFFKDKFVKRIVIEVQGDMTFNYDGLRKEAGVNLGAYFEMQGNWRTNVNIGHLFNSEYKGFNPKGLSRFNWWISYNPSEVIRMNVFTEWEKASILMNWSWGINSFLGVITVSKLQISFV